MADNTPNTNLVNMLPCYQQCWSSSRLPVLRYHVNCLEVCRLAISWQVETHTHTHTYSNIFTLTPIKFCLQSHKLDLKYTFFINFIYMAIYSISHVRDYVARSPVSSFLFLLMSCLIHSLMSPFFSSLFQSSILLLSMSFSSLCQSPVAVSFLILLVFISFSCWPEILSIFVSVSFSSVSLSFCSGCQCHFLVFVSIIL